MISEVRILKDLQGDFSQVRIVKDLAASDWLRVVIRDWKSNRK
jgi:hypothetical protein